MKRTHLKRISILLVFGVVVIMLLPSITAYYSTPNPPQPGFRGAPNPGDVDVSVSIYQEDDDVAIINVQANTGGPIGNPEIIGLPPGNDEWVWVIEFDIEAKWNIIPGIDCEARIEVELWDITAAPPRRWICTEGEGVLATQGNPNPQTTGGLYLYGDENPYVPGTIYHLYVYAQGRYWDGAQWQTSNRDILDLYYKI